MTRNALIFLMVSGVAGCGPDNYEDCVLEKIDEVERSAVGLLHDVCRDKFPKRAKLSPVEGDPFKDQERMTIDEAMKLEPHMAPSEEATTPNVEKNDDQAVDDSKTDRESDYSTIDDLIEQPYGRWQ